MSEDKDSYVFNICRVDDNSKMKTQILSGTSTGLNREIYRWLVSAVNLPTKYYSDKITKFEIKVTAVRQAEERV